jgi:hypothetical protein
MIEIRLTGTLTIDPGSISGAKPGKRELRTASRGRLWVTPRSCNPPAGLNAGLAFAGCAITASDTLTVFLANLYRGKRETTVRTLGRIYGMDLT